MVYHGKNSSSESSCISNAPLGLSLPCFLMIYHKPWSLWWFLQRSQIFPHIGLGGCFNASVPVSLTIFMLLIQKQMTAADVCHSLWLTWEWKRDLWETHPLFRGKHQHVQWSMSLNELPQSAGQTWHSPKWLGIILTGWFKRSYINWVLWWQMTFWWMTSCSMKALDTTSLYLQGTLTKAD